jgi:D-alanine-D-alanine ligase
MITVGVIRGGISPEYEVSLATGGNILRALRENLSDMYVPMDILIDREGVFYLNGLPVSPEKLRLAVDVIWNALHGFYGEDGKIQQLLEQLGIPYTGSGILASALSMHKAHAKQAIDHLGIKMPTHLMIAHYDEAFDVSPETYAGKKAREVFQKMSPPWIVKPVSGGSSVATYMIRTLPELVETLGNLSGLGDDILVEEYIRGREATVGVLENFRGEKQYAYLPIEIRKSGDALFSFESKYNGQAEEISPGKFSREESAELQRLAREIHKTLDLRHYSRSDFIIHPKRGIYFLEANSLPGLTETSLLPKMIESVGSSFPEFVDHVIRLTLQKR